MDSFGTLWTNQITLTNKLRMLLTEYEGCEIIFNTNNKYTNDNLHEHIT